MQKSVLYSLIISVGLLSSCKSNTATNAKIIERKTLSDSAMQVTFKVQEENKTVVDSQKVKNIVLPHDSIQVEKSQQGYNIKFK